MSKNELRIKEVMKEKGVSTGQIAKSLGVTRQSVYRSITGNPTMNKLKKIADILGVPVKELFEDKKKD